MNCPAETRRHGKARLIEWDKDDIDALKFMKVDVLGLGMLGCMSRAFDLLEKHKGTQLDLATTSTRAASAVLKISSSPA